MEIAKWDFMRGIEPVVDTDGFWYMINEGYINPEKLLGNEEQIRIVEDALETLKSFEEELRDQGLLEEY